MGGRSVVVDHAQHSLMDRWIVKRSPNCGSMMFQSRWWSTMEPAPCNLHHGLHRRRASFYPKLRLTTMWMTLWISIVRGAPFWAG
jgi:hypothetical protein